MGVEERKEVIAVGYTCHAAIDRIEDLYGINVIIDITSMM